jgi:hypothetical protein
MGANSVSVDFLGNLASCQHRGVYVNTSHRFPPPWTVDEENAAYFIVRDHDGKPLAYVYFEDEPGRRSAAKMLTRDEARRIAVNIAKLPKGYASDSRPDSRVRRLLHKFRAQTSKFGLVDRARFFQPIEFFNLICGTKAYYAPKLFACITRSLKITLCHTLALKNQIGKDSDIGSNNQSYYPYRLGPAGNVVSSKKI